MSKKMDRVEKAILSIATAGGAVLGILTSIGVFAIPGFGLLYGAGAFVGACAGLEAGFMTGGVAAILTTIIGVDKELAHRYEKQLNEDKFFGTRAGHRKASQSCKADHGYRWAGYGGDCKLKARHKYLMNDRFRD